MSTYWAEKIEKWGRALLVACAILGGAATIVVRTWAWAKAGPEAKVQAADLNVRVIRLERQSRFTVRALEKLSGRRYKWEPGERDE